MSQVIHPFGELSPEYVMAAAESVGIWPEREPFALNSYENRVLLFRDEKGQGWVIKFYRPQRWSDACIQEEHDFLLELAAAGVSVAAPWKDEQGRTLHHFRTFRFALFAQKVGQAPELDNPAHLYALGELLGSLHQVSRRKRFQHRPVLDLDGQVIEAQQRVLASNWLGRHQRRAYETITNNLHNVLKNIAWPADQLIRCHGDCHLGNILGRGEDFTLVDFDDCLMGPAIQDIWMLLPIGNPAEWRAQLSEMAEGYEQAGEFPYDQLALIEPLRSLRLIRHSAWLVSRWSDPAFPAAFPWLADSGYWDQHIRQLEQQRLVLDRHQPWLA
ncbi:serine/threonine protein kinase [Halomonas sp. ZH2S]|uniref:Stress response kinase A n=1 Tax=Vreelandella zhuhanensis TaxID=2684210 RepID=A0A7X3GXH7_9GAMM|nr:serine/threonine protein kinase [Halomonas zhuhanensis]MWJ26718.1 serine/threonine protein kinase [Halomonas zhuhanensis]